jgi:DNA repair protein RadC
MKTYTPTKLNIKSWAEEDRPREKMLLKGRQSLTDAELIAILLGSGNKEETAVDLAKRILADVENNLYTLGSKSIRDFMNYKGIGEAKAITIVAALELGRRRASEELPEKVVIRDSSVSFRLLYPLMADLEREVFYVIYLNRGNRVIAKEIISEGGITGTVVDPRIIFKRGLELSATAIILAHNHPSGNLNPSEADKALTNRMIQAGKIIQIDVLDHLIVSGNKYFSFADEGLIYR